MGGRDPVKVIREAISRALVYYYPFAGRLREGLSHKLMVECTGEGVMFMEADADVSLDQFGDVLQPPFPGIEKLLYDGPGSAVVFHSPLLLIQVTRLMCGGFIFALHLNHTISDGVGLVQFLMAVGEMARGAHVPSVQPVWKRELLAARVPPQVSCVHHAYPELQQDTNNTPYKDMPHIHRYFFFGPQDIAGIRKHLPLHLQTCSRFEVLAACLWRCRTIETSPNPSDTVGIAFVVNARAKFNPPLPDGFYGNAIGCQVALSTAGKLCQNPLGYALELVKQAKEDVTEEFMRSMIDLLIAKGQPLMSTVWYYVNDLTHIGFKAVDYGWGEAVYGGRSGLVHPMEGFFFPTRKNDGVDGTVIAISLPGPAMEKFAMEIGKLIRDPSNTTSIVCTP